MLCVEKERQNPDLYSPLTLAFLGDAVYELLVREYLTAEGSMPVGKLHRRAVELVRAGAQSALYEALEGKLRREEEDILRRGRNANGTHAPKNADPGEYRRATGVEALFGWLYMKGEQERLRELFTQALEILQEREEQHHG